MVPRKCVSDPTSRTFVGGEEFVGLKSIESLTWSVDIGERTRQLFTYFSEKKRITDSLTFFTVSSYSGHSSFCRYLFLSRCQVDKKRETSSFTFVRPFPSVRLSGPSLSFKGWGGGQRDEILWDRKTR